MKRIAAVLGCAVVVLAAALAGSAAAAEWEITTITSNNYNDLSPRASDSHVAWQATVGGNLADVMLYDIRTGVTTRVTNNAWEDSDPRLSASHVVWYEYPESRGNILVRDIETGDTETISDDAYSNNMPRISGDYVVWQGRTGPMGSYQYDLFVYNLDTEELIHLDLNSPGDLFPDVCGSIVVYQKGATGATSVYLYDASVGGGPPEDPLAASAKYPKVSETHAIWQGLGGNEIFLCDIADGTPGSVQQLTSSAAGAATPQIAGSHVVWESDADGDWEIVLYDITSGTASWITNNDGFDSGPTISKSVVAWRWRSKSPYQYAVCVYDLTDPQALPEPLAPDNAFPEVHGWNVVWQSPSPSGSEIALARAVGVNQPPVADAGLDQTAHPGHEVTLNGSGSSDPDEHYPLTYAWEIVEKPEGSTAELSDPTAVNPSFTLDEFGDYRVRLVVTDAEGLASDPDEVLISSFNAPPVAAAGEDQAIVTIGTTVELDGTESYDDDGDPITFAWEIIAKPEGSQAALSDATTPTPTFVADVHGDYVIELIVSDPFAPSQPDSVTVSFTNVIPVAHAGAGQAVLVGETVTLDGSGSSDANHDPLAFWWTIATKPQASDAQLTDPAAVQTTFVADAPGTYVISLVVSDGFADSDPHEITVEAITAQDAAARELLVAVEDINGLDPSDFKNRNMANTLVNKINVVLNMIEHGDYAGAANKLENDVLAKMDGCADAGEPDKNDWLITPEAQEAVYSDVARAIELLVGLLP